MKTIELLIAMAIACPLLIVIAVWPFWEAWEYIKRRKRRNRRR